MIQTLVDFPRGKPAPWMSGDLRKGGLQYLRIGLPPMQQLIEHPQDAVVFDFLGGREVSGARHRRRAKPNHGPSPG